MSSFELSIKPDLFLQEIIQKLEDNIPLRIDHGLALYTQYPLSVIQQLADQQRQKLHGDQVLYNRNIHLEPSNKCIYSCHFCAFYRRPKATASEGAWDYSFEEMDAMIDQHTQITEVHITGGVHPDHTLKWSVELIERIKRRRPTLHVKAFTAVEIDFMAKQARCSYQEALSTLKAAGLGSLPGGGAEIFEPIIRKQIAGGKAPAHYWLEIHEIAHQLGIPSNATMLYGHVENYTHRLQHLIQLRELQERTNGFQAFIPLKYRNENNALSNHQEITEEEDLRNYAVSRLILNNIKHLKTYWVMLGVSTAIKSLAYGVNDFDGTINDTTKIYSMAGSMEHPSLSEIQLRNLILEQKRIPVERDSLYRVIS